jgi:ABC-type branched-subunit amino acid transport system substrate-binding protein
MGKFRAKLAVIGAAALLVSACGRSDDADTATTAATDAPATTAPAATAPAATTGGPAGSDAPSTTAPAPSVPDGHGLKAGDIATECASEPLAATDVGVTAEEITIEVMADTGSPLAPGLFQGNVDAVTAFAEYINANGGVGCRQLVVRTWDSKLDPTESKNGVIDACANAFALVGGNSLFNPDPSAQTSCPDQTGAATGLPDIAALASDTNEMCAATTYTIQDQTEKCPIAEGVRDFTPIVGPHKRVLSMHPEGLHDGVFMVPGDLPSSRSSAMPLIAGQEQIGITFAAKPFVSASDEQSQYTSRVQPLKDGGNYLYNGGNDTTMIAAINEATAQGVDPDSVVWMCSLACYSSNMLAQGGDSVEGTYVWMTFLPFEEADTNAALQAYVEAVGADEVDSFGAQAWHAAMAFSQVVNQIVAEQGPNAITRANMLAGLANLTDFSADGWAGPKSLRGVGDCFVLLQVQDGAFERVWPEERGTFDCSPENLGSVSLDPVAEAEKLA